MSTERTLTRRATLAGAGGLLALGLAGAARATGIARQTPTAETRSFEHKYGTTDVPAAPERIVTVGFTDHEPVIALGTAPVAVRAWLEGASIRPWAEDALGDVEPAILPASELNFEQIAALRPDLIVGLFSGMTEDEYATLSRIGPTIAQPAGYVDFGVPWQEQTRVIGQALGRDARAGELVAAVEARFAEARAAHPEFADATGVVGASFGPGQYFVYGPEDGRGRFLDALGFEQSTEVAALAGDAFFAEISRERLDLIDADLLIWLLAQDGTRADVEEDPIYQRLAVASEGRTVFLEPGDPLGVALAFGTVLSLPYALDGLLPLLAAAVDGDPTTEATPVPRSAR